MSEERRVPKIEPTPSPSAWCRVPFYSPLGIPWQLYYDTFDTYKREHGSMIELYTGVKVEERTAEGWREKVEESTYSSDFSNYTFPEPRIDNQYA